MTSISQQRRVEKVYNTRTDPLRGALRQLAANCDGATSKDGRGFNKFDSERGKRLAAKENWSGSDRLLVRRLVEKYHNQLPENLSKQVRQTDREADPGAGKWSTNAIADAITADAHFAKDSGGQLYVYTRGVYRPRGEGYISRAVKKVLREQDAIDEWSTHTAREVIENIRTDAPALWDRPRPNLINLKNCILDVRTRRRYKHTPKFFSPIQIPVAYDPEAECPKWETFIRQIFPRDSQDLAREIIGCLLVPDTSLQKAFLLVGEGGNGKSAFLNAVTAFIGRDNASNVSLQQLTSNRFAAASLVGKLTNICADLPSTRLEDTAIFKAITGGDAIRAERKYQSSFTFRPYARLLFSANRLPQSPDFSEAFFDRWIVVPFDRRFRGTSREVPMGELQAKLTAPHELSGLLNIALKALDSLRKVGRITEPESTKHALDEYRATTDPFQVWLDQEIIEKPGAKIAVDNVRTEYNEAAKHKGTPAMTETEFGRALKRLKPHIEKRRLRVDGHRKWFYFGIEWRPVPLGKSRM